MRIETTISTTTSPSTLRTALRQIERGKLRQTILNAARHSALAILSGELTETTAINMIEKRVAQELEQLSPPDPGLELYRSRKQISAMIKNWLVQMRKQGIHQRLTLERAKRRRRA